MPSSMHRCALLLAGLLTLPHPTPAAPPSPTPSVRLRVDNQGGVYRAWADNPLAGPVEVRLSAQGAGLLGEPALPARATVPAQSSVLVSRIMGGVAPASIDGLHLDVVPGSANARPQDYEYAYPLQTSALRVEQGWNGDFSHRDGENRYAVDFGATPGTPVIAARDGVVMQVDSAIGVDRPDDAPGATQAIVVRILHNDGTTAVYAHLASGSVVVAMGQRIARGDVIAGAGSTGFSTGPHLHFAVQLNRGMHLESIPFRMFSRAGVLRFVDEP